MYQLLPYPNQHVNFPLTTDVFFFFLSNLKSSLGISPPLTFNDVQLQELSR